MGFCTCFRLTVGMGKSALLSLPDHQQALWFLQLEDGEVKRVMSGTGVLEMVEYLMVIRAYMEWNADESHWLRCWMGLYLKVDISNKDKHWHDQKNLWPRTGLQGVSVSRTRIKGQAL